MLHFSKANALVSGNLNHPSSPQQMMKWSAVLLLTIVTQMAMAQYPPSHDPSTMILNTDGRYWIFTTGDGVWAMSSSNADFTDWQVEPTPFTPGTYPSWINNYVDGFGGFFWAPDVIKIGSTYFLYYSCAGNGAPAAIGVATASNLGGPWTDQGMVVAGNNAIDPALLYDNGRLWMSWGNWQSGIDIIELSTSTGKPISGSTHLVSGNVEGPGLFKSGSYYYLFYQRGLCCNGVNSTYYMVVARSTSITGPYSGERVFLPNQNGNVIGPGHFGYGEGRLTYHFYDGNDNGNAKLMVRSDFGVSSGWPYVGTSSSGPVVSGGTYRITPRHSGKALDVVNCGASDGTNVNQWSWLNNNCQKWIFTDVGSGYYRISPANAPGMALDLNGCSGSNLANIQLWSWLDNDCQKWQLIDRGSGYYSLQSKASGKCMDVNGVSSADGANIIQYTCYSTSTNQQFSFQSTTSSRTGDLINITDELESAISIYPNPMEDILNLELKSDFDGITRVQLFNTSGQLMFSQSFEGVKASFDISELPVGMYVASFQNVQGNHTQKISKR